MGRDKETGGGWRRSFVFGVASSFFMQVGISAANDNMVLSLFVNEAGGSNALVGLTPTLSRALSMLPQLFVAGRLEGKRRKMPYYIWPRAGRALTYLLLLGPAMLLAPRIGMGAVLTAFFLAYGVGRFLIGISQVPRMDILAKAIPSRYFELFWGQRNLWGKVAAFGTSIVVGLVLSERSGLSFPLNYAVLFMGGSVFLLLELLLFSFIREPVERGSYATSGVVAQLRRAPRILRQDPNYARFVFAKVVLSFTTLAGPFYIIYAKEVLNAPVSMVGVYLPTLTLSTILSNVVWSTLAQRRGNRVLIKVSVFGEVLAPVVAVVLPLLLTTVGVSSRVIIYAFCVVFVIRGAATSGTGIGTTSYLLLISPREERPTYIGLHHTLVGLTSFVPTLGGVLADVLGYGALFGIAAGLIGLALPSVWRLEDARA